MTTDVTRDLDEIAADMETIADAPNPDPEKDHKAADDLLLELALNPFSDYLSRRRIVAAFERIGKWYA